MFDWTTASIQARSRFELTHDLAPALEYFASIRRRRALRRDPVFRASTPYVDRVLGGFEWDLTSPYITPRGRSLKAVAWNIERGKRWLEVGKLLLEHPHLKSADLVLLNEVDIGMGRSGNINVAGELAKLLDLNYVYCNYELLLSLGDAFERDHGQPNTKGLHGAALLTRLPVSRVGAIGLPEYTDKFHADEKRLGGKRALFCEVTTEVGPMTVVLPHLDPFAPPRHRGAQMVRIVDCLTHWNNHRVLLGGDLNTSTYDLGTVLGLAHNAAHKLIRLGFEETVRQYMTPEQGFERATFEALRSAGLEIDGFNDRTVGTIAFDIRDPELRNWMERYLPRSLGNWLERKLKPWGGAVPLKIDWFAGRGLAPDQCGVVENPPAADGGRLSDHNPLHLSFTLEKPQARCRASR